MVWIWDGATLWASAWSRVKAASAAPGHASKVARPRAAEKPETPNLVLCVGVVISKGPSFFSQFLGQTRAQIAEGDPRTPGPHGLNGRMAQHIGDGSSRNLVS